MIAAILATGVLTKQTGDRKHRLRRVPSLDTSGRVCIHFTRVKSSMLLLCGVLARARLLQTRQLLLCVVVLLLGGHQ